MVLASVLRHAVPNGISGALMKKSPLALMKERFENKEGLVKAVRSLATGDLFIERVNKDKGLELISNAKLLKLHETLTSVQKQFGSRDKLVGEVLKLEKRVKDAGYKARLEKFSTPRLFDIYRSRAKSVKAATTAVSSAVAKVAKKAPAKKAPAKKAPAAKSKKS